MAAEESDIRWLLTHRAYLYHSNAFETREYIQNRIVYYDILDETATDMTKSAKKDLHQLLRDAHVEVLTYKLQDNNYVAAYRQIMNDIHREVGGRK